MNNPQYIRLVYVAIKEYKDYNREDRVSHALVISKPFLVPENMNLDDACKIVSFLSKKVEKEQKIEPANMKSVLTVAKFLPKLGFVEKEEYREVNLHMTSYAFQSVYMLPHSFLKIYRIKPENTIDLITIGGNKSLFNETPIARRYFNWFYKKVKKQEVMQILQKSNLPTELIVEK